MRLLILAIAGLFALPLTAATRYSIGVETTGDPLRPYVGATVLAENAQRRVEIVESPIDYHVLLSDDSGATFTALNTVLKTWWRPASKLLQGRLRIYDPLPGSRRKSVRDVNVTTSDEPSEAIAGLATHKYVVKMSFGTREDLSGTSVDARVGATILVWTTGAVDAGLALRAVDLTTGVPEVDALLDPAIAKIPGFPLRTVLTATRAFADWRPQTITVTATVSDIRTVDAPPHAFEPPKGYVEQAPIIGAPGR
jgi:hypothetical protein